MTSTPVARPDYEAHVRATRSTFPEVVREVRDILGPKLCAYLGSVKETRAVHQWADGSRQAERRCPTEAAHRPAGCRADRRHGLGRHRAGLVPGPQPATRRPLPTALAPRGRSRRGGPRGDRRRARFSRQRMSCDLETVAPAGPVFRLGRAPDPWAWPDWSQASRDGTFGNRWDDPEGAYRVLYASSTRFGALLETLARFRPDLAVIAGLSEIEGRDEPIAAGTVPREWFDNRLMGVAELTGTYADIGAAASLSLVRSRLAGRAIHHGLTDIDAAAIRLTAPRGFTQDVSRLSYECRTAGAEPLGGIRYHSRLDDGTSNWAVFEAASDSPEPLHVLDAEPVQPDDPHVDSRTRGLGAPGRVTPTESRSSSPPATRKPSHTGGPRQRGYRTPGSRGPTRAQSPPAPLLAHPQEP